MAPDFVTLKDHRPDFRQNSSFQLINPVKIKKIGKISKLMIAKVNKKLISDLHFN